MCTQSRVLLVVSAVFLGGWLWIGSKPFVPPPAPGDEFTISGPFTHGNLTVFLLHGPDAERARPVLGLDEALARQCAIVHETGSVNELAVENTSEEDDLLLLSGDIVKGGRQDRVLQATMILPPKSGKVPVRSFCVEQSRWRKRGREDDTRFAGNPGQIAGKGLKQAVQLAGSQGEVWANVREQQTALTKNVGTVVNNDVSPTSLQLALENDTLQAQVAKFREAIRAKVGEPAGVVGFVTVVNGQVTGAEAFGSHTLFKKAWAKAVSAAAVEAVAAKPNRTFTEMTPAGVRTFLAKAGNEAKESEREESRGYELFSQDRATPGTGTHYGTELIGSPAGVVVERTTSLRAAGAPVLTPETPSPFLSDRTRSSLAGVARNQVRDQFDSPNRAIGNEVRTGYSDPSPAPSKTAVVEYREKGSGAVIHKSFLPR